MLKFEVNSGKRLLQATIGALVTLPLLTACGALSSQPNEVKAETKAAHPTVQSEGFCFKGGKTNDYSCDPAKATAHADMRPAELNEDWMRSKLAEIRKWIAEEKEAAIKSINADEATQESPHTETETLAQNATYAADPREYITTVSVTTPAPKNSNPEIEDILRLSQQGKHKEALSDANALLAEHPTLASAQLTKGIILSNMGDKKSAKVIFKQLMKDYPNRPEAFNNLAVIYSEEGNYPKAIETLQQAFQTHPSYAQVHTNLKELYASMASKAYNKALDLGNAPAGPELAMINHAPVSQVTVNTDNLVVASNHNSSHSPKQVETVTKIEQPPISKPAVEDSQPTITVASAQTLPEKPAQIKAPTAKPATIAEQPTSAKQSTDQAAQIKTHLESWAQAWRSKDHANYIASYTDQYRPNAKLSHDEWVKQRKLRLNKPKFINVDLSNIQVNVLRPNLAEALFNQRYQSDTYSDAVKKRVMLVKTGEKWKISLERSLGLAR